MDKKIVAEMDQKVIDQQNTLEKAGVPGFFITTNPQVNIYPRLFTVVKVYTDTDCDADKCPADGDICPKHCCATVISGADDADEPT